MKLKLERFSVSKKNVSVCVVFSDMDSTWSRFDTDFYEYISIEYNGDTFSFSSLDTVNGWDDLVERFQESNLSKVVKLADISRMDEILGGINHTCLEMVNMSENFKAVLLSVGSDAECNIIEVWTTLAAH